MQSLRPMGRKSISYAKYGYLFILPFFIVYIFFMVYPLINTFKLSFFGNGDSENTETYINMFTYAGAQNFKYLLFGGEGRAATSIHASFVQSMKNTVILWIGNFIPQIILSLLMAVWYTDTKVKIKGTGAFKVLMYMPNIITATSVCALFLTLFGSTAYGTVNGMLLDMGAISAPINFVDNATPARLVVMFIQTWMWYGNTMILLMSGIMGIDASLFEAANIDGANSSQVFLQITLPLLRPIFLYVVITSMIGGLQMFDIPYLFRNGNTLNDNLKTAAVFVYDNFHKTPANYGYSAAASVLLFIITVVLGLLIYRFNTTGDERAAAKSRKKSKNSKLLGGF